MAAATALVERARARFAAELTPVLTHRDIKPGNVLLDATGPVLLDWDGAGPDFAQWEVVRTALSFSAAGAGWDGAAFQQVVTAYRAAGGRRVPGTPAVLAGVPHALLTAAQWLLWRALGHRPVTPAEQAASATGTIAQLDQLRLALASLETWSTLLREVDDAVPGR